MNAIQKIPMDLAQPGGAPCAFAVQGDSGARQLALELRCDGRPWPVPADADLLIRYRSSDGTGGTYDSLTDGSRAWSAQGNVLTVMLAPQVCAVPGKAVLELTLIRGLQQLTTFRMGLLVCGRLQEGEGSDDYTNLAAWLAAHQAEAASVTEADIGTDGSLMITLSNGTVLNAGRAVGPAGSPGADGMPGADGGYYKLEVAQTDANILRIAFIPSREGMAAVKSVQFTLPQGQDGATPVRGVDYWTAADIAAIQSYVETAILGGAW